MGRGPGSVQRQRLPSVAPARRSPHALNAEMLSDDGVAIESFDAAPSLRRCPLRVITALHEDGWAGNGTAFARLAYGSRKQSGPEQVFAYLDSEEGLFSGYSVRLEPAEALEWLRLNRPGVHRRLMQDRG